LNPGEDALEISMIEQQQLPPEEADKKIETADKDKKIETAAIPKTGFDFLDDW
jgi:hypothetical protein